MSTQLIPHMCVETMVRLFYYFYYYLYKVSSFYIIKFRFRDCFLLFVKGRLYRILKVSDFFFKES